MMAKPWKCAMGLGVGLVLLLAAACAKKGNEVAATTPAADSATSPAAAPAAAAAAEAGPAMSTVPCANKTNNPSQDPKLVDHVLLVNKDNKVLYTVPGTACGVVWDKAVQDNIPTEKKPKGTLTTSTVCVWMGDHWECGTNWPLTKGTP